MPINIIDSFNLNTSKPIDTRIVAANSAVRLSIVYTYDGLKVFQQDDRNTYIWNDGSSSWSIEGGLGGGNLSDGYIIQYSSSGGLTNSVIFATASTVFPDGTVGINTNDPKEVLQLNGPGYGAQPFTIHKGGSTILSHNWYYDGADRNFSNSLGSGQIQYQDDGSITFRHRLSSTGAGAFNNSITLGGDASVTMTTSYVLIDTSPFTINSNTAYINTTAGFGVSSATASISTVGLFSVNSGSMFLSSSSVTVSSGSFTSSVTGSFAIVNASTTEFIVGKDSNNSYTVAIGANILPINVVSSEWVNSSSKLTVGGSVYLSSLAPSSGSYNNETMARFISTTSRSGGDPGQLFGNHFIVKPGTVYNSLGDAFGSNLVIRGGDSTAPSGSAFSGNVIIAFNMSSLSPVGLVGVGNNSPLSMMDIKGTHGYNQFRLQSSFTPTSHSDVSGNTGEITWDDNYIYVRTVSGGWKRSALSSW